MLIPNWLQGLVAVFGISLLSLVGALSLKFDEEGIQRLIPGVLALAVGALLGDAFLHLLPDAYREIRSPTTVGLLVLVGTLACFALDQALHKPEPSDAKHILPIGPMSIAANSIHNMVDGVLIGGAFLISSGTGVATLLAVALHEIPHEAANYGVLLHANYGRRKAVYVNFMVGLAAMAGAVAAILAGSQSQAFTAGLLPFTAGCFVYMACADLMPSLLTGRKPPVRATATILIAVGILIMVALLQIEKTGG